MQIYGGHKLINASAMTLGEYNKLRRWDMPENEEAEKDGYLVEYIGAGDANHEDYENYISWSPKGTFESAYRLNGNLTVGDAVNALKQGKRVARKGWNGNGMFLFLVNGSQFKVNREPLISVLGDGSDVNYNAHIDIRNVDGSISTWSPSNGDTLAEDWAVVHAE